MRLEGIRVVVVGVVLVMLSAACGSTPPSPSIASAPASAAVSIAPSLSPSPAPTAGPTAAPSVAVASPSPTLDPATPAFPAFDPATFSDGSSITNPWMPLRQGRRWIWDGVTLEGGERISHRINFTVTDLVKRIAGVDTAVAFIEDISDGELVEVEIAFYAQDDAGTVWYFGEHPEELDGGKVANAPTWLAGVAGAKPGIKMLADPASHTQAWYQGWGPAVEWSDFGRIDATGLKDCVKYACYQDVVRFAESSLGEEGIFQLKSYARGTGEIRTGWRGMAESREELQLISIAALRGDRLEAIRRQALALEARAYKLSPKVYGTTTRMQIGRRGP
jgi:hypothetical protein